MAFNPQGNPYTQAATGGMLWEKITAGLKAKDDRETKTKERQLKAGEAAAKAATDRRKEEQASLGKIAVVSTRFNDTLTHEQLTADKRKLANELLKRKSGMLQNQNSFFNSRTPEDAALLRKLKASLGLGVDDKLTAALNTKEAIDEFAATFGSGNNAKIASWLDSNLTARNAKDKNTVSLRIFYVKVVVENKALVLTKIKRDGAAFEVAVTADRRGGSPKSDTYWANVFTPALLKHHIDYPLDANGELIPLSLRIKVVNELLNPSK